MPVIVTARGKSDSTNDLVRRFKKAIVATDIVQKAKDRRYNLKPAAARNVQFSEKRRLKKKIRSLKKMKNISSQVIQRLTERLND